MPKKSIRQMSIHRFRDRVAVNPPDSGKTFYITADEADALCTSLKAFVADIREKSFTESVLVPEDFELSDAL